MEASSPNFSFLNTHNPLLVRVAASAEHHCLSDPVACLTQLRTLAELLAEEATAYAGLDDHGLDQFSRLQLLRGRNFITNEVSSLFHSIRQAGNDAAHSFKGTESEALHHLKIAREVAVWFHRSFAPSASDFRPGAFVPPPDRGKATGELKDELERLRNRLADVSDEAKQAKELSQEEQNRRREAESKAEKAYDELEVALELAEDAEAEKRRFRSQLDTLREAQAQQSPVAQQELVARVQEASSRLDLDESDTRRLIDAQLREAGWEADTSELRYSQGTRPQKGINQAIAEWPTDNGPADYVLFIGLTPVAIVEAKRYGTDVPSALKQSARYSRGYVVKGEEHLPESGPWENGGSIGTLHIPFLFASNARPYLQQIETKSGVWFRDGRRPTNTPRAATGFYTPEGLKKLLEQDLEQAEEDLRSEPVNIPGLRYYQVEAINAVEEAIVEGKTEMLLAMATGAGKTRTALGLLYRLIKHGRFRRVLFLVDRTTLGEQAEGTFREVKVDGSYAFADVYDVKTLEDIETESDTRMHIATVQGMVRRVLHLEEGESPIPVDQYDCVIIDECHRGYTLDRELSDVELTFRDQSEYISKYRRVIEHFDAVRVGLTATPALHTVDIFGEPIYEYSYRQAVVDGYLVDHEPPYGIVTTLSKDGIHWDAGDEVKVYDPETSTIDLIRAPDEIDVDIEHFNKLVITENFNRAVIGRLIQEIDPTMNGKTLIFCVTDEHCDLVVSLLKEAYEGAYGSIRDDAIEKITGQADRPSELIRHYRNEKYPNIAVTVDLLTTGVDVTPITNLVFLRRVKSRILYEQMLGRATRLHKDLYGPGEDKEAFRIFDAVQLYDALQEYTDMKPVVQRPTITFADLAAELSSATDDQQRASILEQFRTKLHQKRGALEQHADDIEGRTGYTPDELLNYVRDEGDKAILDLLEKDPSLPALLDDIRRERKARKLISDHEDEVYGTHRGYGESNQKPDDYLESFGQWIADNLNEIPALHVVTQRPRELTREQLKDLRMKLDKAGYSELDLRTALQETDQEIAAGIIGVIRNKALGSPLEPYESRVDRALRRILADGEWTSVQRKWLERLARQIKENAIVDRNALDDEPFRHKGGFRRLDKIFEGNLQEVLGKMHEHIWKDSA